MPRPLLPPSDIARMTLLGTCVRADTAAQCLEAVKQPRSQEKKLACTYSILSNWKGYLIYRGQQGRYDHSQRSTCLQHLNTHVRLYPREFDLVCVSLLTHVRPLSTHVHLYPCAFDLFPHAFVSTHARLTSFHSRLSLPTHVRPLHELLTFNIVLS